MNKLIEFFNEKYGDKYGKIPYPRTTMQIYRVYQSIKSYGIKDEELVKLLHNIKLPKPKSIEEKELYTDCLYNKDDSEIAIDTSNLISKENPVFTGSMSLGRKEESSIGENSYAVGVGVEASGEVSHAEGFHTIAIGKSSHTEGSYTKASSEHQHVQGKFNIEDTTNKYAHIVGNGNNNNARSNAHTLDWKGNAWYAGDVQANNVPYVASEKVVLTVPAASITAKKTEIDNLINDNSEPVQILVDGTVTYDPTKSYYVKYNNTQHHVIYVDGTLSVVEDGCECIIVTISGNTALAVFLLDTTNITDMQLIEKDIKNLNNMYIPNDLKVNNSITVGARKGRIGAFSSSFGLNCKASGDWSHAEGVFTQATGKSSHAEGNNTTASGDYSHAEGNRTTASGDWSHAEGSETIASGDYSHAEGNNTTASNSQSHAEGSETIASGFASHAEGSITDASGDSSHAEGGSTIASASWSHAEGYNTTASSKSQHVQGKYNIEDAKGKYAHIVGNGSSENNRSNAHTLDWNGNAWYAGKLSQEGTPTEDKDLATKKYVDASLENKVEKVTGKGLSTVDFTKSYETKLKGLENYNDAKVKEDIETINTQLGDIAKEVGTETLKTTAQDVKGAINEVFQNVSNGKQLIATAITDKGVNTSSDDTFQTMATNIGKISGGSSITYSVTNNLSHAVNNNSNTTVEKYNSYSANITVETGYKLDSITVTMGGADITSSCYSNGNISIEHVTGDIVITVTTSVIPPNTYSVTNTLTQCTSNNNSTTVTEGQSYTATITANTGYTVNSIVVKMGNTDISSSAISGNIITITNVTGNIAITAIATQNALYSFGVMSDIHLPSNEETDTTYGTKYQGLTKFTNVVNNIQNKGLDFVCITGDLTTYGYAEQLANYKSIVDTQEIPFYACNGNHDGENDTNWNTYVGHNVNHTFEKNNDVFIFMNAINESPSIDYLKTQLETYKDKRIFLFMHFPLTGYAGLKTNEVYGFSSDSTKDDEILSLLKSHLNVHCFSGHTHYIFELQENYSNINVSTLDYYNVSLIHVPSLTQPRNIAGNMTDLTVSNQYLEMYKVDVYENKIILHAYNVATGQDIYTYEISTDADYTKANSIITSTYNVAIDEGQSQTFTVKLENVPSEDVVVNLSSASQYVSVSPSTITFTTSNYSTEQTITVNAVDDGTTADYTTLIHLISNNVPNEDVNIAVTNTTVIEPVVQGYDFSSINSNLTEKFVPNEGYPYVYLSGTDAICSNVKIYSTENAVNNVLGNGGCIGGKFKKYKWNNSTKWTFYKDYDATSRRYYPITNISACSVNIEKATWANNTYTPTGEIALQANISLS